LAIQNAVDTRRIGQATSAAQFFRQIGATIGAAVMGVVLAVTLSSSLGAFVERRPELRIDVRTLMGGIETAAAAVSARFDAAAAAIDDAGTGPDHALDGVLARVPVPADEVRRWWDEGGAGAEAGDPVAARAANVRRHLAARRSATVVEVRTAIRMAVTRAVTRIYRWVIGSVLLAFAVTMFLPELPLRSSHDAGPEDQDLPGGAVVRR